MASCSNFTILEKIVNFFPGPYLCKCLLFSSIFGLPMLILTRFFDTRGMQTALEVFGPLTWQNISTFSFANFVLPFYAAYGSKYMRTKISTTAKDLGTSSIMGTNKLEEVFSVVCKTAPMIFFSVFLAAASIISFPTQGQHAAGPISLIQKTVSFPFMYLAYGTFVWVYIGSIKSLHDLGQRMRVPDFCDDTHLGMRPLVSLSLSLALVYFFGLVLVFFSFVSIPAPMTFAVGILIFAGIVMFFLPFSVIHRKMQDKKQEERRKLQSYYRELTATFDRPSQIANVTDAKSVKRILALDIVNQQVASIPEWPFDIKTLTWLSAIVLSVIGSIIAKYVIINIGL